MNPYCSNWDSKLRRFSSEKDSTYRVHVLGDPGSCNLRTTWACEYHLRLSVRDAFSFVPSLERRGGSLFHLGPKIPRNAAPAPSTQARVTLGGANQTEPKIPLRLSCTCPLVGACFQDLKNNFVICVCWWMWERLSPKADICNNFCAYRASPKYLAQTWDSGIDEGHSNCCVENMLEVNTMSRLLGGPSGMEFEHSL